MSRQLEQLGIKAAVKEMFGNDNLAGRSVVVQGIGHVGENLVRLLRDENAMVYVSDINEERTGQVAKKYGAKAVSNNTIFDIEADIYSPCALGATINAQTIDKLKYAIIAGSANNQLDDEFDDTYGEKPDGYVFIEEKPELKIEEEEWPF